MIALEGSFQDQEGRAVVILDKKPFDSDSIAAEVVQGGGMELDFENAEYASYHMELPSRINRLTCSVICPATDKHIAKYSKEELQVLHETPEVYESITRPYVEREELGGRIAWVHNIIDGSKEADRVLFHDPDPETGFKMLPDMKWDQLSIDSLYCLVFIVNRTGLLSLRSLSTEHLPLLRNILHKGSEELQRRYGVLPSQLRVYLHYQPTFYHLHVHFTHLLAEAPGTEAGRAHLLSDVIDNISLYPDYYQKKTMTFAIRSTLGLCKELTKATAS
eukprot:CAMPEP_0181290856 /NCGR_PEP_ID=MMETSP1101-20121128/1647_1 /TAXON_ID=46948 /ORGANISM="Rhodomonas abbreviata, Strain Caron Lab Isolate" /LENGTH=275 /DNA_ID=CAMNT_0023395189 /DNA_START=9 /DNA_END=836 /DNA_ORIENTATION=-